MVKIENGPKVFNYCDDCPGDERPGLCATISSMNRCKKELIKKYNEKEFGSDDNRRLR